MQPVDKRIFLKEYTRAIREEEAALFVGAGVSQGAGYVDWKRLLQEVAEDLDLSVDRETDLVALAQFHVNHRGGRDRINQLLIDEFLEDTQLTKSHQLIASLPVHTIWTTNYDRLLESALEAASKRVNVRRSTADFSLGRKRTDVTLYKMHGDRENPADAILTKDDYETYDSKREVFTIALRGDLAQKTFLFLGFSFTDPNVMYVLGRVKRLLEHNGRKHYCVLRRPRAEDADGAYVCKRFDHWLKDLSRYNIQPVLIDSYDEVPELLGELNRRSHLRDVFISGSAHSFDPLGEAKFRELCRALGTALIQRDFNLISGFGVGVGGDVIVGAMQALRRNDDERLQLWPFPQQPPPNVDRADLWREYRERMISNAGVCVVLAGNKLDNENVVAANGVYEEVAIARARGKFVIPIGATGHVAQELWIECKAHPSKFVGDASVPGQLDILGDTTASVADIVRATIEILKQLDR